jgi:hypothetical protein
MKGLVAKEPFYAKGKKQSRATHSFTTVFIIFTGINLI